MQHKILLLDELGEKWGKTHVYHNLRSPCEALKLLYINYPDLKKYFATAHQDGIGFTVVQAGQYLDYEDLGLPLGQNDLVITPVISGSGGIGKALVGVAMIGLVVLSAGAGAGFAAGLKAIGTGGFAAGGAGFLSASASAIIGKLGVGLVLMGVSEMLSPQPQLPEFDFQAPVSGFLGGAGGITRGSNGSQSYGYTGASNTVGIGKTIPVVYGKALIGGHILSTNIEIASSDDTLMKFIRPPSLTTVRFNGEELKGKYTNAGGQMARRYEGTNASLTGKKHLDSNKVIDLEKEGEQEIATIIGASSGTKKTTRFQILFRVNGLMDFVGEEDTTKIDGFITYQIKIKENTKDTLVLNSQSTIQGLTRKNQNFSYCVKLPYQFIEGKDTYRITIQIVDTGVDFDKASLIIRQAGYKLLQD